MSELTGLQRVAKACADEAGWGWCDEHKSSRFGGSDPCSPKHTKPCGHCHKDTDEFYLLPCPFDAEHCALCRVCKVHADADYGPLGYGGAHG